MKTFWLVIAAAGLGIVFGVGTSSARWGWRAEPAPLAFETVEPNQSSEPLPADGPRPKVVVESDAFDFGSVASMHSVEHAFRVSNEGQGRLKLESGGTTCGKCTMSRIPPSPILPGETADVVVTYHAAATESEFRQLATILTNDPLTPRVELTVTGSVVVPAKVSPLDVVFSRLSATETRTIELKVMSFFAADFAIKSFALTDPETAPFFDVAIEPMSSSDAEAAGAKRGYVIALTVKAGMPPGPIRQFLVLHTNLADMADLEIPIGGSVDSDISIAGGHFERETGILRLGSVSGRTGAEGTLLVLIRGEHRHEVHVSVGHCDAPLQATLGKPSDLSSGAVVQIPLIVKIPPGSPPANHLGHYGKILLETDDPNAKQIRIWVQFAVDN